MRVELYASAVTSGPSYDNVQMLEDDEGLEFTVTGTAQGASPLDPRERLEQALGLLAVAWAPPCWKSVKGT